MSHHERSLEDLFTIIYFPYGCRSWKKECAKHGLTGYADKLGRITWIGNICWLAFIIALALFLAFRTNFTVASSLIITMYLAGLIRYLHLTGAISTDIKGKTKSSHAP